MASDKKQKSKKIEANKAEYKKMAKDITPDVAMYLEHGKAFPGFNQVRRIRGGLKKGGSVKKKKSSGKAIRGKGCEIK